MRKAREILTQLGGLAIPPAWARAPLYPNRHAGRSGGKSYLATSARLLFAHGNLDEIGRFGILYLLRELLAYYRRKLLLGDGVDGWCGMLGEQIARCELQPHQNSSRIDQLEARSSRCEALMPSEQTNKTMEGIEVYRYYSLTGHPPERIAEDLAGSSATGHPPIEVRATQTPE